MTSETPEERFLMAVRSIDRTPRASAQEEVTLAFAAYLDAAPQSIAQARKHLKAALSEEQVRSGLITMLLKVFFSSKPDVQAVVRRYKVRNYFVGIQAAYKMALRRD